LKYFRNYYFLKTKKFDKKLMVDKSTYRHERVNLLKLTLAPCSFALLLLLLLVLVMSVLMLTPPSPPRMAARDTVGEQEEEQNPYLPSPLTCTPELSTFVLHHFCPWPEPPYTHSAHAT